MKCAALLGYFMIKILENESIVFCCLFLAWHDA